MKNNEYLKNNSDVFLNYFKERYEVKYNSNIFLRDIQFAILNFFTIRRIKITLSKAEELALEFAIEMEKNKELIKIQDNTWKYNKILESTATA